MTASTPRRILTEDEEAWLRKAWASPHVGTREIRDHLRIGWPRLWRLREELNLGPKSAAWDEDFEAEVRKLSYQGLRASEIARRLGVSRCAIYSGLKRRGAVAGVLAKPTDRPVSPAYETMLRRVASWDSAAAHGLRVLQQQRGEA